MQGVGLNTIVVSASNSMYQWTFYRLEVSENLLVRKILLSGVAKTVNKMMKFLFGQNTKKLKILKLSRDLRYLQKLALK